jgi:hypothetical protein
MKDPGVYSDPFRDEHYKDPEIVQLSSKELLPYTKRVSPHGCPPRTTASD